VIVHALVSNGKKAAIGANASNPLRGCSMVDREGISTDAYLGGFYQRHDKDLSGTLLLIAGCNCTQMQDVEHLLDT
jgi:hypothetical protein